MNLPRRPDSRSLLRVVLALLLVGAAVFGYTIWSVVDSTVTNSVQPIEVNRAGSQRRLSDRIAYDAARLEADPFDPLVRDQLADAAMELRAIREGLLGGNAELGLDGEVPAEVRSLYFVERPVDAATGGSGADSATLDDRIRRYEDAALAVAAGPGIDRIALAVISAEAESQGLVDDLDEVVAALDGQLVDNQRAVRNSVIVGSSLLGALGVATAAAVIAALWRAGRRVDENSELAEEFARSESMYRTTMDSLLDCVVIQDDEGRVIWMNEAARLSNEKNFGRPLERGAVAGEGVGALFTEDGAPLTRERRPAARALATGEPVVGQLISTAPGDSQLWFRCNATPVRGGRGRASVVLVFSDVTEERRLQAAIASHERRFRLAVQNAPIGTALLDAGSNIVDTNDVLNELLAGSAEALIGVSFVELLQPDVRAAVSGHIDAVQRGDEVSCRIETRLCHRNGSVIDVVLAIASIEEDATEPTLIIQILDISERTRAVAAQREALRQQHDLVVKVTELDKAKTDFVSTVSHELRTPLTSVLGYLEMLGDGTGGALSAVQEKIVATMASSGEHLLDLIEDLLSILTMERGGARREVGRHDLYTVLSTVVERVGPLANKGGVTLTNLVDRQIGLIDGDLKQLERIFNNLLSNAVKFTPDGGLVTIDGCLDPVDHTFAIDIADTGVGIPDDEQAQLFSKFFRSSTALKDAIPGTGLGLTITRELAALHGGTVSLSSLEGVGTTAHVVLPQSSPVDDTAEPTEWSDGLALDAPEPLAALDAVDA